MKENGWKQEKKGGKEEGDQERVHIAFSVKFSLSIWKKKFRNSFMYNQNNYCVFPNREYNRFHCRLM